jgi:hypothetical protein
MTFKNQYNVLGFKEKDFAYNWLGAGVSFTLLGQRILGIVKDTNLPTIGSTHTLDVEFTDGQKTITVRGHFNCFRKVRA